MKMIGLSPYWISTHPPSLPPLAFSIFSHEGDGADDIIYVNWLNMVRAGVLGLEYFTPQTNKWRQVSCGMTVMWSGRSLGMSCDGEELWRGKTHVIYDMTHMIREVLWHDCYVIGRCCGIIVMWSGRTVTWLSCDWGGVMVWHDFDQWDGGGGMTHVRSYIIRRAKIFKSPLPHHTHTHTHTHTLIGSYASSLCYSPCLAEECPRAGHHRENYWLGWESWRSCEVGQNQDRDCREKGHWRLPREIAGEDNNIILPTWPMTFNLWTLRVLFRLVSTSKLGPSQNFQTRKMAS